MAIPHNDNDKILTLAIIWYESTGKMAEILGIIPSRFQSTRLPGKPLADIGGKTMIQRVFEQATIALDKVIVATDDERISNAVRDFGGKAIMTSGDHQSGTDRCTEAVGKYEAENSIRTDAVINIQGDEPYIHPDQIRKLISCIENPSTQIATLVKKITDAEDLFDPNIPKVILNSDEEAMYFSRSPIPFIRDRQQSEWLSLSVFYKHIGVYAYQTDILRQITSLAPSGLEKAESLEQNRWLENGYRIKVKITEFESISIDTPEDLDKALRSGFH